MALVDDLTSLVERLIALDPQDFASVEKIGSLQEEGRARLANRGDRTMEVARNKAVETRAQRALERNETLVTAIKEARKAGCTTYREVGEWLLGHNLKPTRGDVWNINVIMHLEKRGISRMTPATSNSKSNPSSPTL